MCCRLRASFRAIGRAGLVVPAVPAVRVREADHRLRLLLLRRRLRLLLLGRWRQRLLLQQDLLRLLLQLERLQMLLQLLLHRLQLPVWRVLAAKWAIGCRMLLQRPSSVVGAADSMRICTPK